ncbi:MAG TPA: diguanylate cyclase [Acidimicrobiales bacterium]|nr:diguanylate cyclase [Acidimicrobiales bacterium]
MRPTTTAAENSIIDLRDEVLALRNRLAASDAAFVALVQRSSDGMLVLDEHGVVRFANTAAVGMLRRSQAELIGAEVGFAVLAGAVSEVELVRPGGHLAYAELRVVDTEWEGRPCLLALLRDVTDRHHADVALVDLATHDQLTGLPNRFLLEDRLRVALDRLARRPGSVALFGADLDDFKAVNDRWGHAAGDLVLIEAGRRLRSVLRPADSVARVGGDEFVLLCEGIDRAAATELTARIEASFREPFLVSGEACTIGLSTGFVIADGSGTTVEHLLDAADEQMYLHKRRPRPVAEKERLAQPSRTPADPSPRLRMTAGKVGSAVTAEYQFTLYVSGTTAVSAAAKSNLDRFCAELLPAGAYAITSVDVLEALDEADAARILVTPTLIRTQPPPVLRVIGDLSATSQLAEALGLPGTSDV